MKFDVVIGNPPYQESDNKSGNGSATPLYDKFIELSISIKPKYITLITPSVWFLGGKGLDNFRRKMLEDIHVKSFHNYVTPSDVFQNVNLRGGVNFFVWDSNFNNTKYHIHTETIKNNEIIDNSNRPYRLLDLDLFISDSRAYTFLQNLLDKKFIDLDFENKKLMLYSFVSERNPFGIATTMKDFAEESDNNDVKIYASKGRVGFVPSSTINRNLELVDSYKVLTAFANNIGTDLPDDNLNTIISEPNSACTETYLVIGGNLELTRDTANNLSKYLKTKFVRLLIMLAKANQNGTRKTYRFVPLQNFSKNPDIDWSQSIAEIDQQLYRKYELSEEEIMFIEENVKEME